jgi:hypothetical protein
LLVIAERLARRAGALVARRRRAGAERGRGAGELGRHVAAGEQPEDRLALVGHAGEAGRVGDVLVALVLRGLDDGLAGVGAAGDRRREAVATAAQEHVDLVVDLLLGDRAEAARALGFGGAVGHVGRPLAAAQRDVRGEHGGRRVGDLGGGDVADLLAGRLPLLEDRLVVLARDADRAARTLGDALVERLAPGGPLGAGRGGVRVVVGQVGRARGGLDRPRLVEAGERHAVDVELAGGADGVVPRGGDLLGAHAVAEQEDHVLGLGAVERGADVVGGVVGAADGERGADAEDHDGPEAAEHGRKSRDACHRAHIQTGGGGDLVKRW